MKDDLIQQQIDYYRARAGEYDHWFYRRGRYDRGPEWNQLWFAEAGTVRKDLLQLPKVSTALELACGTGIWTEELLKISDRVMGIDASPEVIEINRSRQNSSRVEFQVADLFAWEPDREYDLVFFGFWLSHVPPEKLAAFLEKVRRSVKTGGRLFIVDSVFESTSTARDHTLGEKQQNWQPRKLDDGREFKVVKVFYEPADLEMKLGEFGFKVEVRKSGKYFIYANGQKIYPITD